MKKNKPRRIRDLMMFCGLVALCCATTGGICDPPEPIGHICSYNADCDDGMKCINGKCKVPECASDSDCPDSDRCLNSECVPGPPECQYNLDCDFGFECTNETCLASQCHNGSSSLGVDWKPCPDMQICTFGDAVDLNHGNGWCEPFDHSCSYNSDCPFGFECGAGAKCHPSDCHSGGQFGEGYGPLHCPAGQQCEMGDGVDLNHGNGWCVPSPMLPPAQPPLNQD